MLGHMEPAHSPLEYFPQEPWSLPGSWTLPQRPSKVRQPGETRQICLPREGYLSKVISCFCGEEVRRMDQARAEV